MILRFSRITTARFFGFAEHPNDHQIRRPEKSALYNENLVILELHERRNPKNNSILLNFPKFGLHRRFPVLYTDDSPGISADTESLPNGMDFPLLLQLLHNIFFRDYFYVFHTLPSFPNKARSDPIHPVIPEVPSLLNAEAPPYPPEEELLFANLKAIRVLPAVSRKRPENCAEEGGESPSSSTSR